MATMATQAGTDAKLQAWLAQMKAEAEQPAAVEIGHRATANVLEPQGIVIAQPDHLVFRRVPGDLDGQQLAAVKRLVASVLGGTDPTQWRSRRGGPIVGTYGFLRELLRTCNNQGLYCRPLDDGGEAT